MNRVPFLDVAGTVRWIHQQGAEAIIAAMTDALESDFRRWPAFDKTARIASHSREGVIELMPTSDGMAYGFKYVNGHPANPAGNPHFAGITYVGEAEPTLDVFSIGLTYRWDAPAVAVAPPPVVRKY